MKLIIRLSILLNCGLLGCVALLWFNMPGARQADLSSLSAPPAPDAAQGETFRWSQIESSDYRAYISNLRGIGCPEQTIRDLISADVDSLYAPRRRPLEERLAASGGAERSAAERELEALRFQQAAVMSALFGLSPGAANPTPQETAAVPSRAGRPKSPTAILTPLVFQDLDLAALQLTGAQAQSINDLRERFLQAIGGANQDPADPAYAERWRKSQPEIDQDLRGMIGTRAWQEYQLAARAKAR